MNRTPRRGRTTLSLLALVALAGGVRGAGAQPISSGDASAAREAALGAVDAFAGARFPLAPVPGRVTLAASRVRTWSEGAVRRVLLDGDVRVTLGSYDFRAERAAAWLVRIGDAPDGKPIEQVFVYFEELGSAGDPAGAVSMRSDVLPVRTVVVLDAPAEVVGDIVIPTRPSRPEPIEAAADEALARSLGRDAPASPATPAPTPRFTPAATPGPPGRRWVATLPEPLRAPPPRLSEAPPAETAERGERGAATPRASPAAPARPARPAATATPSPRPAPVPARVPASPTSPVAAPSEPPPREPAPAAAAPPGRPTTRPPAAETPDDPSPAIGVPIFAREGVLTLAPGNVTLVSGEDENAVLASGGVSLQYTEAASGRTLQMTARRAAIFLDPGRLADLVGFTADRVRGIFLEGDVTVSDGRYTVRGPQVYYDVRANKAVMLDAVFWTYDQERTLPLYVRAKTIHQESAERFRAEGARFTNTAFFDPELSIGASTITITRQTVAARGSPLDDGRARAGGVDSGGSGGGAAGVGPTRTRTIIGARDVTLRAAGVPFFYWPRYSADPANLPLRDLRVENRSGSGAALKATINAYALVGVDRPRDASIDLLTDFYFERGPGLGVRAAWEEERSRGRVFLYGLPDDRGTDILKPGTEIEREGEFRGLIVGEQRWQVDDKWTLFAEGAYIGDEAFIDAFFDQQAETSREFTNRLLARRLDGNTAFTVEAKGTFNDFLANEYLLQSRGYSVNKLPEAVYARQADDLLAGVDPGLLTHFSEYRAGRVGMSFDEVFARERGFTTDALAQRAFGIGPDGRISDRLRDEGYFEGEVTRGDTRQELSLVTSLGPVTINPFAVGRITAYDDSFDAFSPDEGDSVRLWGGGGVRVSTTVQRVYDELDSRLLDVHRLRHIIEPSATVFVAGTNIDGIDLPIYDDAVESLAHGTMGRVGLTQTFQTQRGGPGRWQSVDLLRVSTDLVWASDDADRESPIARFFEYRPELSNPADAFIADLTARVTDASSLVASTVFDLDRNRQAASSAGVLTQHGPAFSTLAEVRYLDAQDATYINGGLQYELTSRYAIAGRASYDVDEGGFQSTYVEIRRQYASMILGLSIQYDNITGETSFGFVFQPRGASGAAGIQGLGAADPRAIGSAAGGF